MRFLLHKLHFIQRIAFSRGKIQYLQGMRQWWVLKSQHFNTILFFKVGKFYELYHMDADVGVKELGFTYMRGEFAHSGFPEQSFDRMSTSLVERGYNVARVEQTETPDMMQERTKKMAKPTKFDKVVSREVCQVVNKGTQVFGQQIKISNEYKTQYMLAITEKVRVLHQLAIFQSVQGYLGRIHGNFDEFIHFSRHFLSFWYYSVDFCQYRRDF